MEEIVRAFNYVIEKGWVRFPPRRSIAVLTSVGGVLLGYLAVDRTADRGGAS